MMKKSIIAVTILVAIIAYLPTIGNSFITKRVNKRLVELKSFGITLIDDKSQTTYLHTSRHFEFLLQDSQKFLEYLQEHSDKQIPSYINVMFQGVHIGVDIKYSNLPFAKAFELELYPMSLPQEMSKKLQNSDLVFYKNLKNFLALKGLLYHIEYNLLNDDFKAYIKDINEKFLLKDTTEVSLTLKEANFKGSGPLLAPQELRTKIKKIDFSIIQKETKLRVAFSKMKSSSDFESVNTYLTSIDIGDIAFHLKEASDDINISIQKLRVNASSNAQELTSEIHSKNSIKSLKISSKKSNFIIQKFNFDFTLSGLAKQEYLKLTQLLSEKKRRSTLQFNSEIKTTLMRLLSKGFVFEIADFSVDTFSGDTKEMIKGFHLSSTLILKEDKQLEEKMKISPLLAIQNITLKSEIRISKEMYKKLKIDNVMLTRFDIYKQEDGENYIFRLKFFDNKATINGKGLN